MVSKSEEYEEHIDELNILNKSVYDRLMVILGDLKGSDVITDAERSMANVIGKLNSEGFDGKDIIKLAKVDNNIIQIKCNFGELDGPLYVEKKPVKVSNKGRKPKPKIEKKINRKAQGTNTCFGSQFTCEVKLENNDNSILKIKVFGAGTVQIPGIKTEHLHHINDYVGVITNLLDNYNVSRYTEDLYNKILESEKTINRSLRSYNIKELTDTQLVEFKEGYSKSKELIQYKKVNVEHLYMVLDNFKFRIKDDKLINETRILNLKKMSEVFAKYTNLHKIIQYNKNLTHVSIKYVLPFFNKEKMPQVVIYSSGKINTRSCIYDFISIIYKDIDMILTNEFDSNDKSWFYKKTS